jgi:hypothetical protein
VNTRRHLFICANACVKIKKNLKPHQKKEKLPLHLVVKTGKMEAKNGIDILQNWLNGARDLIICDPYFLNFNKNGIYKDIDEYAESIIYLIPPSVMEIDLYTNSYTAKVRKAILNPLKHCRIIRHFNSNEIHDRFIIKDGLDGKMIGTSFGGFGRKFFSIVDLSLEDTLTVKRELYAIRPKSPKT